MYYVTFKRVHNATDPDEVVGITFTDEMLATDVFSALSSAENLFYDVTLVAEQRVQVLP